LLRNKKRNIITNKSITRKSILKEILYMQSSIKDIKNGRYKKILKK